MKQPSTKRRFIKPLIIVAILAATLLLALAVCLTVPKQKVIDRLITLCLPSLHEEVQVEIGQMDLRLWSTFPDVEVELIHPVIRVPVPDSVSTLFAADTLCVRLRPMEIKSDYIRIRSALISRPRLQLIQYDSTANYAILEPDTTPSQPMTIAWDQVTLTQGTVFFASDSLGIRGINADNIFISTNGHYADSAWSVYADAALRCEDAEIKAKGLVSDSLDIRAYLSVPHVEKILTLLPKSIRRKTIKQNELKGRIRTFASAQGYYTDKRLPRLHAFILLDSIHGGHPNRNVSLDQLTLRAEAKYHPDCTDSTFLHIDTLQFRSGSSWLYGHGQAYYREQREWIQLDVQSDLHLKELVQLAGLEDSIRARGRVKASISTYFYLDDLLQQRIYDIHSSSTIEGDNVLIGVRKARTRFEVDSLRGTFQTNMEHKSRRSGRIDTALFRMHVAFRQMTIKHRRTDQIHMDSTKLFIYADSITNSASQHLHAALSMYGVQALHKDSIRLRARRLRVSSGIRPYEQARFVPQFTARLAVDSMAADLPRKAILQDSVRVQLNIIPRYRRFYRDSITHARVLIPDSARQPMGVDSLLRLVNHMTNDTLPLEKSFMRYFRTYGTIRARRVGIWHEADDLRPTFSRLALSLEDTVIRIDTCRLRIGRSRFSLKGTLRNMRGYLLRGRTLQAQLQLRSRRIDINQLANTITQHQQIREKEMAAAQNQKIPAGPIMTDELDADSLQTDALNRQLVVLPANLDVTFKADVDTVLLADMRLNHFKGMVRLQDQALSITNMSTSSKVGKMKMHVLYACRDTSQAESSFSLKMDSVQVHEVLEALPKVDSILPMLKSFEGSVSCEMAAQLRLKSDLSIDYPSIHSGLKLKGEKLVLLDSETFSEIIKNFNLDKKTKNIIDSMKVELLVENNEIRILPFRLSIGNYCADIVGIHNLNGSFNYHLQLIKPHLGGLNLYGKNFDKIDYILGSPKIVDNDTGKTIKIDKKEKNAILENDANAITNVLERIRSFILNVGTGYGHSPAIVRPSP